MRLSGHLYGYHHEAAGKPWRRRTRTRDALLAATGLDWVPAGWTRSDPAPDDPWVRWSPPVPVRSRCKVYAAPRLEDLAAVLPDIARAAVTVGAAGFKVGGTPRGLTRPDRFLVYLRDREQADALVALAGVDDSLPGRGVPFTASLDGGRGMFSLGSDPEGALPAWLGGSWRRHVTDVLAGGLAAVASSEGTDELVRSAIAAARRSRIDPLAWEMLS